MRNFIALLLISIVFLPVITAQSESIKNSEEFVQTENLELGDFNEELVLVEQKNPGSNNVYRLIASDNTYSFNYSDIKYGLINLLDKALKFEEEGKTQIQNSYPVALTRVNLKGGSYIVLSISDRIRQITHSYYLSISTAMNLHTSALEKTDLSQRISAAFKD